MRILTEKRAHYERIAQEFAPVAPEDDPSDPLKKSENPRWAQYFKDAAVREEIKRDTDRLFQDVPFFQHPDVQSQCLNIIFYHLRQYPHFSYLQGFHEVCGVIFYAFTKEMQSGPPADETDSFSLMFDRRYIEADVFWVYSTVIEYLEPFYRPPEPGSLSYVQAKCAEVQGTLLRHNDPELADCLVEVGVEGVQYMIAWLRIMFARVFKLDDSTKIWSRIFAYYPEQRVIDRIAIAMIALFRDDILIEPNQCSVLEVLVHPRPPNVDRLLSRAVAAMTHAKQAAATAEPACIEMENMVKNLDQLSVNSIVAQLEVFRDVLWAVGQACLKSEKEGQEDVSSMLGGEMDRKDATAVEAAPVVLPKAAGKAARVNASLLTEESDEPAPKKVDLFAKKPPVDLFG
jgi:hypothetical protein